MFWRRNGKPQLLDDLLSEWVESKQYKHIRNCFNQQFWQAKEHPPKWKHLKIALYREDKIMVKLLLSYNVRPTSQDMKKLKKDRPDKYGLYVRMLRLSGLPITSLRIVQNNRNLGIYKDEKLEKGIKKSFIDGGLRDQRIEKLPPEWLHVLKVVQNIGAEEAVIAGGALRDTFCGKEVRDVNIFLKKRGSIQKNRNFLYKLFKQAKLPIIMQETNYKRSHLRFVDLPDPEHRKINPKSTKGFEQYDEIESWRIFAGPNRTEYNIVFVDDARGVYFDRRGRLNYPNGFGADGLIDAFDCGICQISCDGWQIRTTEKYRQDILNKKITVNRKNYTSVDHLKRLMLKYQGWSICDKAKEILRKEALSRDLSPHLKKPPYL